LKSCAPLARESASVTPRGLEHDRQWMAIDDAGRCLTGRERPRLTLIRAFPTHDGILFSAPDHADLHVSIPNDGVRTTAQIWDAIVEPLLADPAAHAWFSAVLGQSCRIVYMDAQCVRPIEPGYAASGDEVSFADGYPLLLISQASLDHLNAKLKVPVSMLRFRPNLVVDGTDAHAEDAWKRIRIGSAEFDLVKTCSRCVFTTVDFTRGERDPSGEPLRTLITYRRSANGVTFGQNLVPRGAGILRVGAPVEILA
jgi:uncharacterized protein